MTDTTKLSHAEQNAQSWYETICELVAALNADRDRLEELRDERDGYDPENLEELLEQTKYATAAELWADLNHGDAEELAELEKAVTYEGAEITEDDARERIQEGPLSVEVRSGWVSPGTDKLEPEDFCILLTTGAPALRIRGELDEHKEPRRAWMEHQDWGTPWTQYCDVDQNTLLDYCLTL